MEVRGTWERDGAIVRMMDGRMVLHGTADVPISCRAPVGSTAIEVVVPVEILPGDTIAVRVSQPGKVTKVRPATLPAIREDLAQGVYERHHGNMDTHRLVGDVLDVLIERDRVKACQGHTSGVDPDLIAVYGGSKRDNERGLREERAKVLEERDDPFVRSR